MFTRHLSILIAAGVLFLGIASSATAEENGKTIKSQEQVRINEQHEAQVKAGDPAKSATGETAMTQDRTQTRDRLRDKDRDYDRDQLHDRVRERIHDHQGAGSGNMGGGMSGPRR